MDINLKTFCREVPNALVPYKKLLDESQGAIGSYHDKERVSSVQASLSEIQNRLGNLSDRLEGQNTYLLIFGPLKSGKSTLMNAISKSYVSEVTSLPAYPCLVYVKNAEHPKYSLTSYSGKNKIVNGGVELKAAIDKAHIDLGKRLLIVEKSGEEFDPRIHATSAIRRVDIELPADELGHSGIVLVDTPGLYTRMKFGYGLMTREFRNHAACAVFVVKAENLFFEQVFAEFEDLLTVFSRIFLVVNIDANKKDLAPDGSLKPSVEAAQPAKLVEAFEALAMSVPLSEAYHEGRLKIYTADLLTAAQARLSDGTSGRKSPEFERFMTDLTEYLQSSDYVLEFMKDSISQGQAISKETHKLLVEQFGGDLAKEKIDLGREERDVNGKLKRIDEISRVDWRQSLAGIGEATRKEMAPVIKTRRTETERELEQSIGEWMKSKASLGDFVNKTLQPKVAATLKQTHAECLEKVRRECQSPRGGASLPPGDLESFKALGISLEDVGQGLAKAYGKNANAPDASFTPSTGNLVVKKRFWDYILLRSSKWVTEKLLGGGGTFTATIPPEIKLKRLGPDFQNSLMAQVRGNLTEAFDGVMEQTINAPVKAYRKAYVDQVNDATSHLNDELKEHRQTVTRKLKSNTGLLAQIAKVDKESDDLKTALKSLASTFLAPDGKSLARPKAQAAIGNAQQISQTKNKGNSGGNVPAENPANKGEGAKSSEPTNSPNPGLKAKAAQPVPGSAKEAAPTFKSSGPVRTSVSAKPVGPSKPIGAGSHKPTEKAKPKSESSQPDSIAQTLKKQAPAKPGAERSGQATSANAPAPGEKSGSEKKTLSAKQPATPGKPDADRKSLKAKSAPSPKPEEPGSASVPSKTASETAKPAAANKPGGLTKPLGATGSVTPSARPSNTGHSAQTPAGTKPAGNKPAAGTKSVGGNKPVAGAKPVEGKPTTGPVKSSSGLGKPSSGPAKPSSSPAKPSSGTVAGGLSKPLGTVSSSKPAAGLAKPTASDIARSGKTTQTGSGATGKPADKLKPISKPEDKSGGSGQKSMPAQSDGPAKSAGPVKSAGPAKSAGPVKSAAPVKSAGPVKSAAPVKSAGPAKPATSPLKAKGPRPGDTRK